MHTSLKLRRAARMAAALLLRVGLPVRTSASAAPSVTASTVASSTPVQAPAPWNGLLAWAASPATQTRPRAYVGAGWSAVSKTAHLASFSGSRETRSRIAGLQSRSADATSSRAPGAVSLSASGHGLGSCRKMAMLESVQLATCSSKRLLSEGVRREDSFSHHCAKGV
ncbi:hypothetical protein VTK56DRAFT_1232 [Thermocarpiscus australiensis]